MNAVLLPPPLLGVSAERRKLSVGWWFLNLILPGAPMAFRGDDTRTKVLGWSFVALYIGMVFSAVLFFLLGDVTEAGLWLAASGTKLSLAFVAGAIVVGIVAIAHALGVSYLVREGGWKLAPKVIFSSISTLLVGAMLAGTGIVGYNVNNLNMTLLKIQEESVEFEPPQVDKGSLSMPEQDESKPVWGDANRINIMILGSDAGPDRWGVRPDILMVASINTVTGNTNLFNVPRNMLYARFPEGTGGAQAFPNGFTSHEGMVNAVWTWAESRPDLYPGTTQPGLVATRDVLSETFGLDIQHYIVLNLRGFEDFVNVMGGVTLNIPRDIPYNNGDLAIPAGDNQHLNGEKALWFARERKTNTDYDRMQRQRCVVGALVDQITPTKILTQTERLMSILGDNLSTNLKQEDISDWVGLFEKVQKASLTGFAFIPPHINPANPDYGFIKGKVAEIIAADDAANTPETPQTPEESEGTDETDGVSTPSVEPSDTPPPPPVDSGYDNPYCTT